MEEFTPEDKHIFTQKTIGNIGIGVVYTSMVANDKSIFIFGGDCSGFFTPSAEVRMYGFSDKIWYKLKDMPHYLWGATAQIIDDEIFIMGGGRVSTYTSYNLAYNIKSDSWKEKTQLPISRKGLVSGVIDGIIYIAYGNQMWGVYIVPSYCYAYNPKTDTWKECQRPSGYRSYAMSVVIDKFLYVLGGYGPNSDSFIKMDRYSTEEDLWESMPCMPKARKDSVAVAIDSKIFILCGTDDDDYSTIDYYDTITRKWTITDIPTPQLKSPGVAMVDNKIYLTAGIDLMGEYNKNLYEITYGGMKE